MIVVDTNIIAHFWLPSDSSDLVEKLFLMESDWVAPLLWKSEFRSVVLLYLRKNLINFSEAIHITAKAENQMKEREFHVNSIQVFTQAEKSDCSAYDCEFISLAEDLDIKLVTLDKKVLNSFPERAKHPIDFIKG